VFQQDGSIRIGVGATGIAEVKTVLETDHRTYMEMAWGPPCVPGNRPDREH